MSHQQPYYDPDDVTLAAARRIRVTRSLKFVPYAVGALILLGVYLGVRISGNSAPSVDVQQIPDQRYADLNCGAHIYSVSIPTNGYQLSGTKCLTVISVNSGAARVFGLEGQSRTFEVGAGMRSNPHNLTRVMPVDGWTNIDIITLPAGQTTYSGEDFKTDHPAPPWRKYVQ